MPYRNPVAVLSDARGRLQWPSARADLRVASPQVLATLESTYEVDTKTWGTDTVTGGTVTHVATESAARCAVTATSASRARLRTNDYFMFQAPGSGGGVLTFYCADAGQTNQVRRWGLYDDNDGVFFQLSGTTLSIVRRSSVSGAAVDTTVAQSSWNVDKVDGTAGTSFTLDVTKANAYEFRLEGPGAGRLLFFVNGVLVQELALTNSLATAYTRTMKLPVQVEVVNTGASTASSVTLLGGLVYTDAGAVPLGYSYAAINSTDVSVTTTERPVLSIRPRTTYNAITNRMAAIPTLLTYRTIGSRLGVRLVANGTLTGASFANVTTTSGLEFDVAATALTGGETLLRSSVGNANEGKEISLALNNLFSYTGRKLRQLAFTGVDVLTVMAVNEQTGTTSVKAGLSWLEMR